ncbi:phosphotransferase [Aquihabitans sp. McL0605]|uniref:phosphotransferase n=1 Tax=Aquihabitans sp. McL0605 TaxID=3415671 RepID=UPI003CFA788C
MSLAPPPLPPVDEPTPHDLRIDWRFLLADEDLGRVALHGPVDRRDRVALASHADIVGKLGDPDLTPHDVAVLIDPTAVILRRAIDGLAPGGAIHIEHSARRRRRGVRKVLTEAGFDTSTWWHRPSISDTRCLVALDRPDSAATVLQKVAGRGRRTPFEVLLARHGRVARWADDVSILAVRPEVWSKHAIASPGGDRIAALVTPRYAASRAVIGVATARAGDRLARVAKVARNRADDGLLANEADLLDRFTATVGPDAAVPLHHHLTATGGRMVLVEDAAPGEPLDRRAVRHDRDGALLAGIAWMGKVPVSSPTEVRYDGRAAALIAAPLQAIGAAAWQDPAERDELVERATEALQPLADATLPAPFEHGDFSHPNLFRQPDGTLIAIDWELAQPAGLPLHDLVFYVGYLAESVERPRTPARLVEAHRQALGPGGWARTAVDHHLAALGIDGNLLPQLVLSCWTRRLATLPPERVLGSSDPHRYETLWRASLAAAEEHR